MRNRELVRYNQKLDGLFNKAGEISEDPEVQAHWARYLCVLVCGFLEIAVRTTYGEYARNKDHRNVSNYVTRKLNLFRSPKMGNIVELTKLFSKEWADDLERATEGQLKDAVDSIVAVRHEIAHGKDTGISYVQLREYYQSAVKVAKLLEKQCN